MEQVRQIVRQLKQKGRDITILSVCEAIEADPYLSDNMPLKIVHNVLREHELDLL